MPNYEDFSIRIGTRRPDGAHPVVVVRSPNGGSAEGELVLPPGLDSRHLGPTMTAIGRGPHGVAPADSATRGLGVASLPDPDEVGSSLYTSLFVGDVDKLFRTNLGYVSGLDRRLRIKLHLNLADPSVAPLAGVPWELMYDAEARKRVVLNREMAIVRYLEVPEPIRIRPMKGRLRVLFVTGDSSGLKLDEERTRVRAALDGVVEMHELNDASYQALEKTLEDLDPHIIHFMGHGSFQGDEGALDFCDGPVTGKQLAPLLYAANEPDLRLVVLNACRTAEVPRRAGVDPFGGVASALVMAGIPAVIAMQFPISDPAAIAFSVRFYTRLAGGDVVEDAVHGGRMAVRGVDKESTEWATPVLFKRTDARLFQTEEHSSPDLPDRGTTSLRLIEDDELNLLYYMADRAELVFQLGRALRERAATATTPIVSIVHGDDSQCLDMLRERLRKEELPRLLDLDARHGSIIDHEMPWPAEGYASTDDLFERLTVGLTARVQGTSSLTDLRDHFSRLPVPAMVCSQVLSSEWDRYPESVMDDYLEFWRQWAVRAGSPPLLPFLFVKYQVPEFKLSSPQSFLKRRQALKIRAGRITPALERVSAARDCVVLPELGEVTEQDIHAWSSDHGRPLSDAEIKDLFTAYEKDHPGRAPKGPMRTMPMVEIAERLRKAVEAKKSLVGGLA